jgi:hypothetical protein
MASDEARNCLGTKELYAGGGAGRARSGVNSLEKRAIVADFILSPHVESTTYRRNRRESWVESATRHRY